MIELKDHFDLSPAWNQAKAAAQALVEASRASSPPTSRMRVFGVAKSRSSDESVQPMGVPLRVTPRAVVICP